MLCTQLLVQSSRFGAARHRFAAVDGRLVPPSAKNVRKRKTACRSDEAFFQNTGLSAMSGFTIDTRPCRAEDKISSFSRMGNFPAFMLMGPGKTSLRYAARLRDFAAILSNASGLWLMNAVL